MFHEFFGQDSNWVFLPESARFVCFMGGGTAIYKGLYLSEGSEH